MYGTGTTMLLIISDTFYIRNTLGLFVTECYTTWRNRDSFGYMCKT